MIRGFFRLGITLLAILLGTLVILALAWLPLRVRSVRLAAWPAHWLARFLVRLYRVHLHCPDAEKLRQHQGFIFPNHLSFFDIVLLMSIWPVRFVSMAELRRWPLIGWIAGAIDTVFVDRADKRSRQEARQQLAKELSLFPPIVIFPEGRISNSGTLQPFRYGAFEIAVQSGAPFLPCVFQYERWDVVKWTDEPLLTVLWRVARFNGSFVAQLKVLRVVRPLPTDDPKELAVETHKGMNAILTYTGRENDMLKPDFS